MMDSSAWQIPIGDRGSKPYIRKNCQLNRKFDEPRIWPATSLKSQTSGIVVR